MTCLSRTLADAVGIPALFLIRSASHPTPVMELALFRIRSFSDANAGGFVFAIGFFPLLLGNVLFLTTAWRYPALGAGVALTPGPIAAAAAAPVAGRLADRFGQRAIAIPGSLLFAAGALIFILRTGQDPPMPDRLPACSPDHRGRDRAVVARLR